MARREDTDPPRLAQGETVRGDLVLYRAPQDAERWGPWQEAEVKRAIANGLVLVLREGPHAGTTRTVCLDGPGQVKPLSLREQVARAKELGAGSAPPRPVRLPSRPAPRPAVPCASYLAIVQASPCCGCGAPAPSENKTSNDRRRSDFLVIPLCGSCHRQLTEEFTLPGRDRHATMDFVQEMQTTFFERWWRQVRGLRAQKHRGFVTVPLWNQRAS